jgi:hypothetical protein
MAYAPFGIHAVFGIDSRRDPARERLAPLLRDASARERRARRLLGVRLLRRSRWLREARA